MSFNAEPIVGSRYRDLETDEEIEIVGLDEYEGIVTVIRDDAEDEEKLSLDEWYELSVEPTGDESWEAEVSDDDFTDFEEDFDED